MSEDSTKPTDEKSGGTRSKVLFAILALGLVALAYDYRVARPAVEVAYNQIAERSTAVNARSTEIFTNMDVRELLGKEPSRTFDDANGDVVEVFSWRSGLPIKTHDLFAVYKPNGGKNLFYRHAKYKYEASGDVSTISTTRTIEGAGDAEDYDEAAYEAQAGSGEGDGGVPADGGDDGDGRPGGGRGGGGGFNPEAMFAENDADGDGILKGEEISDRMRENLAEIDTDGDGGVSKDEMMARFAARRAGGGRPGGGRDGGSRPNRPEAEDSEQESEAAAEAQHQAEMKAENEAKAKAEAETEVKADTETETEAEAKADPETETEAEAKADTETETEPEAETKGEGDEA